LGHSKSEILHIYLGIDPNKEAHTFELKRILQQIYSNKGFREISSIITIHTRVFIECNRRTTITSLDKYGPYIGGKWGGK